MVGGLGRQVGGLRCACDEGGRAPAIVLGAARKLCPKSRFKFSTRMRLGLAHSHMCWSVRDTRQTDDLDTEGSPLAGHRFPRTHIPVPNSKP